jgi:hypothetical protein
MKKSSLFCFVCHAAISQTTAFHATLLVSLESKVVCFVCHAEISQTTAFHATLFVSLQSKVVCFALFVMLRSPKPPHFMLHSWYLWKALHKYGVHQLRSRLFGAMV